MRNNMFARASFHVLLALLLTSVFCHSGFAQGDKKTAYAILLDNTGSLRNQFVQVEAFGKGLVHRTSPRGPVSLFSFMSEGVGQGSRARVTMGTEWTQDEGVLNRYLEDIYVQGGQTTLLDAISLMAEKLDAKAGAEKDALGHKVIIMVTDGEDRVSYINERKLFQTLHDSGVAVYAVGFVEELESRDSLTRKSAKKRAMDFLEKVTKETGGRVIFPKTRPANIDVILGELLP
ncbi:MAG TPA: VWA domain-containing protein [Pyrinomonadaceae bacterium]|nr:VWA domain-containing protein [Pyrinomonadaceae bacterium]